MTKVQERLIRSALSRGSLKLAVHLALLAEMDAHSNSVYLDNAYRLVEEKVTRQQWAGYLGALEKEGVYESCTDPDYRGHWGYIARNTSKITKDKK